MTDLTIANGKLLPVQGAETFSHLVLPSATLACSYIAMYTKMIRGGIVENMGRRYAVYGRARGLKKNTVLWRHVLPNALNPVFTTLAGNGEADCQRCCWKGLSGHPGIYTGDCGGIYTA